MIPNIVWLDIETTGLSLTADRVVEIAMIKTSHALVNKIAEKHILINPGIPIPPAVSEIHKITDEMVKDQPLFKQYAKEIEEFTAGCDLGTYNGNRFDIPLLAEEFSRCGIRWPEKDAVFIDGYQIFARKEQRTLSAAMRFYCDKDHSDETHGALADIKATIEVFRAQLNRYSDLSAMTTEEIAFFCNPDRAMDIAGTIAFDKAGVAVYNIGKDKGKSIGNNPGFGNWMLKQDFTSDTKNCIKHILFNAPL